MHMYRHLENAAEVRNRLNSFNEGKCCGQFNTCRRQIRQVRVNCLDIFDIPFAKTPTYFENEGNIQR